MKNKKLMIGIDILLGAILVGAIIIMCFCFLKPDEKKFKDEYESLNDTENAVVVNIDDDNNIKYLSIKEVFDFFNKGTGVIYFGFPGCPWCRNMLPVLINSAKQNNTQIYYFNPKEIRNADNQDYEKLVSILSNYLTENDAGVKTLYVPDVYFVKNGEIMGNHLGTVSTQQDPHVILTDDQKQELLEIYNNLFDLIK